MKSAVIVASGLSSRYGSDKLKINILGKTVLERSVDVFRGIADEIIVVGECDIQGVKTVKGGSTRFQSVTNGLNAVSDKCDTVAVHDGARPFASRRLVCELFDECERHGSAVPCLPVTDTVWQQYDGKLLKTDRNTLLRVQTPQVFGYAKLKNAFDNAKYDYTDESSLFVDAYGDVHFVDGEYGNIKITYPEDLADLRMRRRSAARRCKSALYQKARRTFRRGRIVSRTVRRGAVRFGQQRHWLAVPRYRSEV